MKLKTLFHLLGFRPPPREYGYEIRRFMLQNEGEVEFAQWLHPGDPQQEIAQDEVSHLQEFLDPGDVAIDVGAYTGDTTLPIALAVGPTGLVFALEPNPHAFRILEVNSRLNRTKVHIQPLPFAAAAMDGPLQFEYSDSGFCNGGQHEGIHWIRHGHLFKLQVDGKRLEPYLRERHAESLARLKYIKTDAEGSDRTVLESIREIIKETRPFIRSEIYKFTSFQQRLALLELLTALDYRVHKVESEVNYFGQVLTESDLMNWQHYDIFAVPT